MWTTNMVKFLFGTFALSAGLGWIIIGAILIELPAQVAVITLDSLLYVVGCTMIIGGAITCFLGIFLLWYLTSDFIKDQTYNFRNRTNYDEE